MIELAGRFIRWFVRIIGGLTLLRLLLLSITLLSITGGLIAVDDTTTALGFLAGACREETPATVIAVTGSNGKTTVKRMIHHVLSRRLKGSASPKSFNNNIGVPLTLLSAGADDQYVICETGTNNCDSSDSTFTIYSSGNPGNLGGSDAGTRGRIDKRVDCLACTVRTIDDRLRPTPGGENEPDEPLNLGWSVVQHDQRLLDLDCVLAEMRRPAAQPEAQVDGKTRPARAESQTVFGHAGQQLSRAVEDFIEPVADVGRRSLGFGLLAGKTVPDGFRHPGGQIVVIRSIPLLLPPGGPDAVVALGDDDVAERLADGPLDTARIGVPHRIRKRNQQALEVPAGGGRRTDEVGRSTALYARRAEHPSRIDRGELERLANPVEAVSDLLLAAALPGPRPGENGVGDRAQFTNRSHDLTPSGQEPGRKRAGQAGVGVSD